MATRLKPTRINVDNTPRVGDGATYQNDNDFHWSMGGGDMEYRNFEWVTISGNALSLDNISSITTPTENFSVSVPAGTLKAGIEYHLRVNSGSTPYTMTLGTGVTNPNGYSTEIKANAVTQFKFIATSDSQLELEGVDTADFVTLSTQQTITAKKTFNVEPELGTAKTTDATNDGTKLATEAQVYKKIDKVQSPTADHLASLTSGGEVADSGIAKSTVELNTNKEIGDAPTDTTSKYPSSHTVKKYVDDQVAAATAGAVSDTAYDATTWDGVTGIAPSKNAVRDKIVTMDSAISGNTSDISTINGKIPSEASTSNQLADKAYVGDSINSVTAFYITKNAAGDQFATYSELAAATTFYSGGQVRVPTRNDYTIVLDDENHDHATTRYIYNSVWEYQYTVNETPLTQAQLNALNSGITSGKVSTYDAYATNKQDKLVNQTNIKSINNNSLLGSGNITLNDVKVSATAPSSPTEGMVWYDTTNDQLKVYDGINWNVTGKEYNAGKGIEIGTIQDYSAMQGPAPDGFHVPLSSEWQTVYDIWTDLGGGSLDGTNFGIALKLPFAGVRDRSSAGVYNQGTYGNYWSSSRSSENNAYHLNFNSTTLYPQNYYSRAGGYSVRCFKDSPVIPTSSWTKLYGTSIEAGGIFWSSTDGLISLSSDGTNWITIADKNLGATTVWNSGDTLSEANSGKYYQWGNNYGFPFTGSVTTSSTQVDASNYGPGNYYESSTFITRSSTPFRWDTTDNGNLRGGVTGVVTIDNAITNTGVLSVNGQTGDVTVDSGITKVFTLSSTSDLTNAQAAYDWYVSGGNPIIKYSDGFYVLSAAAASVARFTREDCAGTNNYGYWTIINNLTLSLSSGTVTSVSSNSNKIKVASSAPTSGDNSTITLVI